MEYIQKVVDFSKKLNRENVFRMMECREDSHNYQDIIREYESLVEPFFKVIEPIGIFKMGHLQGVTEPVVYALMSLGDGISRYSTQLFQKGSYMEGTLIDMMADDYLFSMQSEIVDRIEKRYEKSGLFMKKRIDPYSLMEGKGMEILLTALQADIEEKFSITSGSMLSPAKSLGEIFVLSKTKQNFSIRNSCESCVAVNCKLRKTDIKIKVLQKQAETEVICKEGESLLEALSKAGISMNPVCAGRGTCGKCKVRLVKGKLDVTDFDRKKFTPLQLQQGFRLSCSVYPKEDCVIELGQNQEAEMKVVAQYADIETSTNTEKRTLPVSGPSYSGLQDKSYFVAIDIGTTTIAMNLIGNESRQIVKQYACVNGQRVYGSDVISRILASNQGKSNELQQIIRDNLLKGLKEITQEFDNEAILQIVISANTTMTHLLLRYSCEDLGTYPFTPVHIDTITLPFAQVFGEDLFKVNVTIMPGISAFVGGDIVAGLYACNFDKTEQPFLFVDLGTNGEIAVGNKHKIFVTSTAAGPAFEGGNIAWGVSSVPGAISGVCIENGIAQVRTIEEKPPIGLCGTGVVETVAALLKAGFLSDSGLLTDKYFASGFPVAKTADGESIVFTQEDIRELQLAKAAIRAGIELLLLRAEISSAQIARVYLAGGFGFHLDPQKAVYLGLFPDELADKIQPIGNSSLAGAAKYAFSVDGAGRTGSIIDKATEINLANDIQFSKSYIKHMFFDKSI